MAGIVKPPRLIKRLKEFGVKHALNHLCFKAAAHEVGTQMTSSVGERPQVVQPSGQQHVKTEEVSGQEDIKDQDIKDGQDMKDQSRALRKRTGSTKCVKCVFSKRKPRDAGSDKGKGFFGRLGEMATVVGTFLGAYTVKQSTRDMKGIVRDIKEAKKEMKEVKQEMEEAVGVVEEAVEIIIGAGAAAKQSSTTTTSDADTGAGAADIGESAASIADVIDILLP